MIYECKLITYLSFTLIRFFFTFYDFLLTDKLRDLIKVNRYVQKGTHNFSRLNIEIYVERAQPKCALEFAPYFHQKLGIEYDALELMVLT